MFNLLTNSQHLLRGVQIEGLAWVLVAIMGCIIALVQWLVMISILIPLSTEKRNINSFLMWHFFVPGLNLLWIPWALIITNGLLSKVQERYRYINVFNEAEGIKILSFPLLILYLFWSVIMIVSYKHLWLLYSVNELITYLSIIVTSFLIVLGTYLIYVSRLVLKIIWQMKGK